ncbi:MAG TPA: PQQ-binding-like beta-propeller repeat protein [Methylomirabilota bacterium]|nr:PQQ-binding-like beta-propeller repeat protein [Methylomirabilota bacterium]
MNAPNLLRTIFALAVTLHLASAADWPQFLGPTANGVSTETNLLDKWPAQGPPTLWSKSIGTGYSAPSIRDGKLILHHRVQNEEIVESFEAKTGKSIWRHAYASNFIDPYGYNNGPRCTPLLTTNRCYTFGAEGKLLCLDLQTGKLIWQRDTQKDWTVPEAFFGVGSTPILEGDKLIVMIGGQPNSGVVAFDAATGKTLWESVGEKNWNGLPKIGWPGEPIIEWNAADKQASYASPVAGTVNGKRQIFCLMRQGLVSLDPNDGKVNFSYWFRARVEESVNAANPVVVGNQVLISGAYYRVGSVLLEVAPDNKSATPVWRGTSLEIHWTTPIYHDGNVYAFSGRNEPDARFRCVEFKTGKIAWERDERWQRYGSGAPTYGRGSAILADGKLIVLGESGLLGLVRANPEKLEEISKHKHPELEYPCWAAPVLSDKHLYLRSESKLVCINLNP